MLPKKKKKRIDWEEVKKASGQELPSDLSSIVMHPKRLACWLCMFLGWREATGSLDRGMTFVFPFHSESKKFCIKCETEKWLRINPGRWQTMVDKLFKGLEPSICEGDRVHKENMRSGDNRWGSQCWCQGSKDASAGRGEPRLGKRPLPLLQSSIR